MAGSLNKVLLIGNLARDPEFRSLGEGRGEAASLRLITNESWKDRETGERRERSEGHNISIYHEQLVRLAREHFRKGMQIYLEGQVQTRKYTDGDGKDLYRTEIVLQRYRGEIVILSWPQGDNRSDGGGDRGDDRNDDRGTRRDDRGGRYDNRNDSRGGGRDDRYASDNDRSGSREPARRMSHSFSDEMDDVPF